MPSVLVELGFLTNKKEGAYLNSKKGQIEMSNTIADAIIKYKNRILKGSTVLSNDIVVDNTNFNNLSLKIQIASGSKFLPLKSYNFKGLSQLTFVKSGNNYKYFFENTDNYNTAKKHLIKAIKSGFNDAVIVAFNNGKKISLDEFFKLNPD
jgi:N-acetylmuramoyl-L-alanine amidase